LISVEYFDKKLLTFCGCSSSNQKQTDASVPTVTNSFDVWGFHTILR